MDGMFPAFLAQLLGIPPRKRPSQLYHEAVPTYDEKTKITMPREEFLAAPVTDIERKILGLAPRGMLSQLNRQALDRELNATQLWHAMQRGRPKSM